MQHYRILWIRLSESSPIRKYIKQIKMKNYKILFSLLIVISLLSSCRKDTLITDTEIIPTIPQINVEATITGFVTDEYGEVVPDAEVFMSNTTTKTNELGFFEITGLVDSRMAVMKISKFGYFDQYETYTPSSSKSADSRTRIQLINRNISGSFIATNGGEVTLGNNSTVSFQKSSFVDEANNPYTGQVNVYAHYIDPTHTDIDQFMPGNLMAVDEDEELNILQSFGMINVELEGANGQALNINQPATLNVEVPTSISGSAPSEIPLWYFDEKDGLWKEEGKATLENGKYVGTVNHFTFWNCDVPFDLTLINGQIIDPRGAFLARVRITDLATGASFTSWTDSEGFFAGGVPQNTDLLLEILGFCGEEEILFSANIGPFSTDSEDLGTFEISNNIDFTQITGTLVDCNQVPLTNGQVYFIIPGQNYTQQASTDASGNFTELVPTCIGEDVLIKGKNLLDGFVSQTLTITIDSNPFIELDDIEVCSNISGTLGNITMILDGQEKIFNNCTVQFNDLDNNDTISYLFSYTEALPPVGDSIFYYFLINEANDDINNPNWLNSSIFWGPPESAESELYFTYRPRFEMGISSIDIDQTAEFSGDIMKLTLNNINIGRRINDPDGPNILTNFPGSTMIIEAVLQ